MIANRGFVTETRLWTQIRPGGLPLQDPFSNDLNTTSPTGRLVAHVVSAVAEFERDRVRERTREALAVARANGAKLGRPPRLGEDVVQRIVSEREAGLTLSAIADRLNLDGVPTAQGGRCWWPSTVRGVLARSKP